ncbi:hypothetical protein F4780DRAFT_563826 [Xylariomycetidae sp. FL0641]|nr:hypothetical protein F4780DRAFT_563826 [Xylariomycetidae sp. FL0641]
MSGQDIQKNFINFLRHQHDQNKSSKNQSESPDNAQAQASGADPGGGGRPSPGSGDEAAARHTSTGNNPPRARSASPARRSRARPNASADDPEFSRAPQQGTLWSPEAGGHPSSKTEQPGAEENAAPAPHRTLMRQPETRPITQDQLVSEVKGIYAGLVMVESKCIEVDNAQSSQTDTKLNNEQWQALIALHRTLLHEHHDFFLASQHPSASEPLRRLAIKYAMPARMWRHGIHSFLELLRHRLPASLEHMLTFIYLAYSMMALLYETVDTFQDTWIECLGDLGRYRMAIEDDDIRDRETWTAVSRHWYSMASDKAPNTGRLYHHLAILARPNALQQLFYYTKSLCVPFPFGSARESIMTLFDPLLGPTGTPSVRMGPIDVAFVKAHGILFSNKCVDDYDPAIEEFLRLLDYHIGRTARKWMESGYYIGIANCCALLSYGTDGNALLGALRIDHPGARGPLAGGTWGDFSETKSSEQFQRAIRLAEGTYDVAFRRLGDSNVLPFLHTVLVFMHHLTRCPEAMGCVEKTFPWKLVSLFLNSLLLSYRQHDRIHSNDFPREQKEKVPRPLPEDFAMKGLLWVHRYFPEDWFSNQAINDDEKYFEVASMTEERRERILWVGCRIAAMGKWLLYDQNDHKFSVVPEYEREIDLPMKDIDMTYITEPAEATTIDAGELRSPSVAVSSEDPMDLDDASSTKPVIRQ